MVSICEIFYWGMKMATFGGAMIDEEERPVDSGVIPKTYTVRLNKNRILYFTVHIPLMCYSSD